MQLDAIRLFCDVASQRSVSRAAKLHGITQSAASQRIQGLEKELGVQLVDRSKRPLQTTAAGEMYYRGTRRLLEQYEQLCQQLTQADDVLRGEVHIAAIYSAGIDLLNQLQEQFQLRHPQARVTVEYLHPEQVAQRVRNDQAELGILSYPERVRDLASRPLRDEVMAVVCRPDHRLAGRESVGPADLADVPLVMFESRLPINRRVREYLRSHGVQPTVQHSFDNIDTIKTCVVQGGGTAILPARTAQPEARRGLLAVVPLRPTLVRPLAIVYHRGRDLSPLVRSLMDFLVDRHPAGTSTATEADARYAAATA